MALAQRANTSVQQQLLATLIKLDAGTTPAQTLLRTAKSSKRTTVFAQVTDRLDALTEPAATAYLTALLRSSVLRKRPLSATTAHVKSQLLSAL